MKKRERPKTEAPPIGDRLLTLREAADVLRLSTRTVSEYVQRGEIEGRIIGGRWRFRRADLDTFFANARRSWDFAGRIITGNRGGAARAARRTLFRSQSELRTGSAAACVGCGLGLERSTKDSLPVRVEET